MTMRSLSPLACRTVICIRCRSTSLTRNRQHSETMSPLPYMSWAIKRPGAVHVAEQCLHLESRQHRGHAPRSPGPHGVDVAKVLCQHVPVEEDDRVEGLVLGARGDFLPDRQIRQEGRHVGGAQVLRVPPRAVRRVKADEPFDPVQVGLLRLPRVVPDLNRSSDLVEKPHGPMLVRSDPSSRTTACSQFIRAAGRPMPAVGSPFAPYNDPDRSSDSAGSSKLNHR
jgi:hypothetical protein